MGSSKKNINYFNNDYGKGNHAKELFKNAIKQHEKEMTNISPEKIEQAFAIIDSHSRLLNDQTMINNYNIVVQTIGSILTPYLYDKSYNHTEESIQNFIKNYFEVYIDYDELNENEDDSLLKNYRYYVEDYVINSCMTYYALMQKNKELLSKYNKNISEALKNMFTVKNKMLQREMMIKSKKEGIKMPKNTDTESSTITGTNEKDINEEMVTDNKETEDANV